jgi:hypothetical protein
MFNSYRSLTKKQIGGRKHAGHVFQESEVFSVRASASEDRHLTWFTNVQEKAIPHQILIGWTGRAGSLLNLHPP